MGRDRNRRTRALGAGLVVSALALVGATLAGGTSASAVPPQALRLNQIQVVGSHNSYHLLPPPAEVLLRRSFIGSADEGLLYEHAPLPEQFSDQAVRQIELDVWLDTQGGRYANPLLRQVAGTGPYDPAMQQPGIKVFHVQDVDYASTCLTLVACLQQVKSWSDANPAHVPIAILLELKDDTLELGDFPFVVPEKWTTTGMDSLDAEIRSVFSPDDLITPDDVRGGHATLDEAVTTDGWPTLEDSRGKVMFLMDNGGGYRSDYLAGHPALAGRVLFTNANPGDADAGFVKMNDSSDEALIAQRVRAGYVVRTRADADTAEARANDTTTRDAALRSGAQWVSTDYPVPGLAVEFTSPYYVQIPGGVVARCNPVNAPVWCSGEQDGPGGLGRPGEPSGPGPSTTTVPPTTTPGDGGLRDHGEG
ncbi:MAG: phosphatidylinositol-specific phospholipase C1-like protein [Acidimicrobiales bacterium]